MTNERQPDESVAVREVVWGELLACYGEGEDTDWPYLEDLANLVTDLAIRHARGTLIDGGGCLHQMPCSHTDGSKSVG